MSQRKRCFGVLEDGVEDVGSVDAGVDTLEYCTFINPELEPDPDPALLERLARSGIALSATIGDCPAGPPPPMRSTGPTRAALQSVPRPTSSQCVLIRPANRTRWQALPASGRPVARSSDRLLEFRPDPLPAQPSRRTDHVTAGQQPQMSLERPHTSYRDRDLGDPNV